MLGKAMEIITLIQTGKCIPMPLLFLEPPGGKYWSSKVEFLRRELLDYGYIDPADLDLFTIVHEVEAAIDHIHHFYRRYHSMRYVGERLIVQLQGPLDDERVVQLQEDFSDTPAT